MVPKLLLSLPRFNLGLALAVAVLLTGCASSGSASKSDEKNAFAAYPVDEIIAAGNKALDAGEPERAVYIYMQALEIEQSAETWYRIGVGKSRLGDKGYAWKAFQKATELDPEHAAAQQELGLTYMAMAQPEQAREHLNTATELDPTLWRAWNALGVLADMDKHYAEAVQYYHSGLIGAPQSAMLMSNIGYSYYLAGNLDEAANWFGRALIAEESYPPAVKNLALVYARQGWYDEAVKTFSKVVSKPQAYNDVGYLAMRQGDLERAHELLTEAVRLSPTYYEKAYENLELVNKQLADQGKSDPANTALRTSSDQIVVAEGQPPRKASVRAELLNVRSSPATDADIITHLKAGDQVDIIMTMPEWAFINYQPSAKDASLTGWVNSRFVGSSELISTLVAEPVSKPATTSNPSSEAALAAAPIAEVSAETEAPAGTATIDTANGTAAMTTETPVEVDTASVVALSAPVDTETSDSTESNSVFAADIQFAESSVTVQGNNAADTPEATAETPASITDDVARKADAVCEQNSQAEKTPQGAGSCIGVASLSADN